MVIRSIFEPRPSLENKLKDVRAQKFPTHRLSFKLATQKGNDLLLPKRQKRWGSPTEFTRRTSQVRVASQVRVTSQVRVRSQFFFSSFFFSITNDVRAVTRNINVPVVDIFHSRSKEPLPLRIAIREIREFKKATAATATGTS